MDLLDIPKSELMDRSTDFHSTNSSNGGNGYIGGSKKKSTLSSFSWNHSSDETDQSATSKATVASGSLKAFLRVGDTSLFSSSLPATFQKTFAMSEGTRKVVEAGETGWDEVIESLEEMESWMIGNVLPDDDDGDDELFTGRSVDFLDSFCMPNSKDEVEDFDLFSSVGGLELEGGSQESHSKFMNINGGLDNHSSGPGYVIGEHPYGEHPSRTLLVRNINTGVEDSELRALFQQYGDIRTLYTEACKLRGFVIVSYYDIRAARSAMRGLQTKRLWNQKLDIHFYIPKENPSNKEINQGTLVIFNLDASVSNNVLCQIFGAYGEVKEVRETPHKRHHKFIEFYDVRASEAALKALNRTEIAGKRIKVEPSRPGGARRSLMQMLSQELEQEEICGFWPQAISPITISPPGHPSHRGHAGSPVGNNSFMRGLTEPIGFGTVVHGVNKPLSDWATAAAVYSTSPNVGMIEGHLGQGGSLTKPQLMWGNSNPEVWSRAVAGKPYHHQYHHHHHPVGDLSSVERHLGPFGESPDTPFLGPGSYSPNGILVGNNVKNLNCGGIVVGNSMGLNNGGMTGIMSPQHRVHRFNFKTAGPMSPSFIVGVPDHGRTRRTENCVSQLDHQRQFVLDLERIIQGQDSRTTLMIKNIPNKYTSEMLLATIDEKHRRTYNFLYLPIDFKNKCNVGYAFINMTSPSHIIPFYETFNGKKWEKFNSEKVASLAYARIQGKSALITHFQNSSLMNEDKRCRPILFRSDGPEAGEEEPFPLWINIQFKSGKDNDQGVSGRGDFVEKPDIGGAMKDSSESK